MKAFEDEIDQIVSAGLPSRMPDVLYHYTTWDGFRGIVSSQRFHFREHGRTNDPAEIASIDEILTEAGHELLNVVAEPLRRPLVAYLNALPERRIGKIAVVYLACFSLARDKPSQWTAYAQGGRGVCLGLRVLHEEAPPQSGPRLASLPVVYDADESRATVRNKFRDVVDRYAAFGRKYTEGYAKGAGVAWSAFMRIAATASIRAKKSNWSSEEEWRTIVLSSDAILTPLRKPDGAAYLALQLRESPHRLAFAEILLGPRQELAKVDAITTARRVLEESGYPPEEIAPIKVSTVTLPE